MDSLSPSNSQGEHYNLRWNNFFTNLAQVFSELLQSEQMVDVTLICEDKKIRAHKIILSACSGFFMDLFRTGKEIHPVIIFHEIKYAHLKHIISFLYQGEVKVLDTDLEGVLSLGEKFQVKGLSSVKLKNKVTPSTELDPDAGCTKNEEIQSNLRYEIRSLPQIIVPNTIEVPIKGRPKCGRKNRASNSLARPLKKAKIISNLNTLNASIIQERQDDIKSNNTASHHQNEINNENDNSVTTFTVKVEETLDSSDDKTNIDLPRENSLMNNSNKNKDCENTSLSNDYSKTKPNIIKKPVNAFILFSKDWRKKLEVEYPNEDFKSISVRLGDLWKSLTSETRESYYVNARQEQLNYQIKSKTETLV